MDTFTVSGYIATVTVSLTMTADSVDAAIRRASILIPMLTINSVTDAAGNSYIGSGVRL